MNRSRQVREIFLELRASLGDQVSASELLASAASLVALFDKEADEPKFGLRTGGVPFSQWAVDRGMADGGWRVLATEWHNDVDPNEDEMDRIDVRRMLSTMDMEAFA